MLQTEAGINAVLERKEPVRFPDLPEIAIAVGLEKAGIAPDDHLDWLRDAEFAGGDDAFVLVVQERERWLSRIENSFREIADGEGFPDDLVVAASLDVPWASRCVVVPTFGIESPNTVMLYAIRPSEGSPAVLTPIALTRGDVKARLLHQRCQLSMNPDLGCLSSGCSGTCFERRGRSGGALVRIGCVCA